MKDEILEYPYEGTITRTIAGKGMQPDTVIAVYEGVMDEHMQTDEIGRSLQTSAYIVCIPLTYDYNGVPIVPRKGDKVTVNRFGELMEMEIDNVEPSQLGGISIYASRNSWK
jgi:hypothetical protein